jgi:hypothetical protein
MSIDNVSSNTKFILDAVGINSQTLYKYGEGPATDAKGNIIYTQDPVTGHYTTTPKTIANAAEDAARGVFNKVRNGQFTINQIPLFAPPLEAAYNRIRISSQQFEADPLNQVRASMAKQSDITPYAMDLGGREARTPKQKFLFVVQFKFNAPYMYNENNLQRGLALYVKKSTRPGVKYATEDVNYYNFRTKYTAKAEFEEMSMQFYDDGQNNVAALYTAYTRAMSPVLNYTNATTALMAEREGLSTTPGVANIPGIISSIPTRSMSSGSTALLQNDQKNIFKEIILYHVYANGRKVNRYTFINPRVTSFDLDDLSMDSGDVNTVDMKFNYDSVYTELELSMADINFPEITGGKYPLHFVGDDTDKYGGTIYGNTLQSRNKRGSCMDDSVSMAKSALGAAGGLLNKITSLF